MTTTVQDVAWALHKSAGGCEPNDPCRKWDDHLARAATFIENATPPESDVAVAVTLFGERVWMTQRTSQLLKAKLEGKLG